MALFKCTECGSSISTKAAACPQCGAKIEKRHSKWQWIFIGLATIGMVSCIINDQSKSDKKAAATAAVEAQKTPEQRTAESAEKAKKEQEFQRVVQGARQLKAAAKDPSSFKLESAIMLPNGTICYAYRAKNSFNAIVPGTHVMGEKANGGTDSVWDKNCAGKTGTNYTHARVAI